MTPRGHNCRRHSTGKDEEGVGENRLSAKHSGASRGENRQGAGVVNDYPKSGEQDDGATNGQTVGAQGIAPDDKRGTETEERQGEQRSLPFRPASAYPKARDAKQSDYEPETTQDEIRAAKERVPDAKRREKRSRERIVNERAPELAPGWLGREGQTADLVTPKRAGAGEKQQVESDQRDGEDQRGEKFDALQSSRARKLHRRSLARASAFGGMEGAFCSERNGCYLGPNCQRTRRRSRLQRIGQRHEIDRRFARPACAPGCAHRRRQFP